MTTPNFNLLDTKIGDRVLNGAAVVGLLGAGAQPLNPSSISLGTGTKTASAVAGAATLNQPQGKITSESLTTAAGSEYVMTLANSGIAAADIVQASVQLGSSTTGEPQVTSITVTATQVIIVVKNIHASAAFNGTVKIAFVVFKA